MFFKIIYQKKCENFSKSKNDHMLHISIIKYNSNFFFIKENMGIIIYVVILYIYFFDQNDIAKGKILYFI